MNNIYKIIFEDGTIFLGGESYFDTKWNEIPNKKIKSIIYKISFLKNIVLSDYDKYYHIAEATQDLNGINRGKINLLYAYILGKLNNKVRVYKINLKTKKIEIKDINANDNFILGLNPNSWKGG